MTTAPSHAGMWRRVLIEGAVIVVSILLAFAIDAWWDGRKDRVAERQLLASIERDLRESRAELMRVLLYERRAALFERLAAASPEALRALPDDSARTWLRNLFGTVSFQPFDGAIRGGDLSLIQDPRIREKLFVWIGRSEDLVENNPLIHSVREELEKAVGLEFLATVAGIPALGGDRTPALILGDLRSDRDVMSLLLRRSVLESVTSAKAQRLLEITDELLALLPASRDAHPAVDTTTDERSES